MVVEDYSKADEDVCKGELLNGKYAVFTISHTVEAVQEFWSLVMNCLQEDNLQYDVTKPIIERYKLKLVKEDKCEFCIPIM